MHLSERTRIYVAVALLGSVLVGVLWMRSERTPLQARQHPVWPAESFVAAAAHSTTTVHPGEADPVLIPDATEESVPSELASLARVHEISSAYIEASRVPPITMLENLRTTFRQYHSRFGGNPVGTNIEITQALAGGNPGHTQYLNPDDGLRVNDRGELVDSWGTPFFFHQLSRTEMEIHSAGPDRRMGTSDDLVLR